jgi:hypothetical protein
MNIPFRPLRSFDLTVNASGGTVTNNNGSAATGTATFSADAANNDTLTVNGVVYTFKTAPDTSNPLEILRGVSRAATLTALAAALNASRTASTIKATYSASATVLTVTYADKSPSGNAFTLAKSSTAITLSASTLAGATFGPFGQDVDNLTELYVRLYATVATRVAFGSTVTTTSTLLAAGIPEVFRVNKGEYVSCIAEGAGAGKLSITTMCN